MAEFKNVIEQMAWFLSCLLPYPMGAESPKKKRQVYIRLFQISAESLCITKVLSVSQEERLTQDFSTKTQFNESNVSVDEDVTRVQKIKEKAGGDIQKLKSLFCKVREVTVWTTESEWSFPVAILSMVKDILF